VVCTTALMDPTKACFRILVQETQDLVLHHSPLTGVWEPAKAKESFPKQAGSKSYLWREGQMTEEPYPLQETFDKELVVETTTILADNEIGSRYSVRLDATERDPGSLINGWERLYFNHDLELHGIRYTRVLPMGRHKYLRPSTSQWRELFPLVSSNGSHSNDGLRCSGLVGSLSTIIGLIILGIDEQSQSWVLRNQLRGGATGLWSYQAHGRNPSSEFETREGIF